MRKLFEGIRVIDFTTNVGGPSPTALLADFGADVIKIERPKVGDPGRNFSPLLEGTSVSFMWLNRGKKSIVLDMDDPEGVNIAQKLSESADLVVESFKPGTMKKFGLDYESIKQNNERIIYCSISAFGQTGPYSKKAGYDVIAQALSGIMDMTGSPVGSPTRIGFSVGDHTSGVFAFAGIASALYYRELTGKGQLVDISILDCLSFYNGALEHDALGYRTTRSGNHHKSLAPFGAFEGNGGMVVICAPANSIWASLCRLMNKEEMIDDPLFSTSLARAENIEKMIESIEGWLQSFDNIDEPLELMDKLNIPSAKINATVDLLSNEQLIQRNMIAEMETSDGVSRKKITVRGNPLKLSKVQAEQTKAPNLGQHTDEILQSIGYNDAKITALKDKWSIN